MPGIWISFAISGQTLRLSFAGQDAKANDRCKG